MHLLSSRFSSSSLPPSRLILSLSLSLAKHTSPKKPQVHLLFSLFSNFILLCLKGALLLSLCRELVKMGMKREKEEEGDRKRKRTRKPCCTREGVTRGMWTPEEDKLLVDFITQNGHGTWRNLPEQAGLQRCGKSCRLRWTNYLRPDIKRGPFSPEEESKIIHLHGMLGNKWAAIASNLAGRTDNDVKNFWNSHLRKRVGRKALLNQPSSSSMSVETKSSSPTSHIVQWENVRIEAESRLSNAPLLVENKDNKNNCKGDYFINLWNSKVGESFRSINESINESTSPSSSLTKVESTNLAEPCKTSSPVEQKVEVWNCKKESEDPATFSDTPKSFEVDDSSDAMMKMLLDFPIGGEDMEFLEPPLI